MPGIDGLEVLREVKKKHPDIEVIVLTGHGSEEDEKEAERLGASAYLTKPVDLDELLEVLKKKKLKVLLVDDEKEFVESLSERLELRNLKAAVAYDGERALKMIKKEKPDVMVLDLRMPGIDGIEVLRRAKKKHPDMPIVVLTGHGTEEDEKEAFRLGASAYLRKPVDIDHLVGTLHSAWNTLRKAKKRFDTAMMAAALAQAGARDMARDAMDEIKDKERDENDEQG
ncbi:MAG: response regulator [Deltaproteobacteria bacterium]|nr:response regulator [Deltaproteobacteria bacterium]MBW2137891.1 response regulator [Deltaproteobacteria bacterium]